MEFLIIVVRMTKKEQIIFIILRKILTQFNTIVTLIHFCLKIPQVPHTSTPSSNYPKLKVLKQVRVQIFNKNLLR